jgi:hypothetical protein
MKIFPFAESTISSKSIYFRAARTLLQRSMNLHGISLLHAHLDYTVNTDPALTADNHDR